MLKSENGQSFWTAGREPLRQYPWLSADESCDVLVLGGGVTGALLGYRFAESGSEVCLLTRRPVGYGGAAFGGGMLTYDGDLSLVQLGKSVGRERAVGWMRRCAQALDRLEALCEALGEEASFRRRDLLNYTPEKEDTDFFRAEYLARRHNGFPVEYVDAAAARERCSFLLEDGIRTADLAAEYDPYRFAQAAVAAASERFSLRCYENTEAVSLDLGGGVRATTGTGRTVRAEKLILATGTGQRGLLRQFVGKKAVCTVVTEPVRTFSGYPDQALLRCDAGRGFSVRTTPDGRLLITGEEGFFSAAAEGISAGGAVRRLAELRYWGLEHSLREMFCGIPGIVPAFRFREVCGYLPDLLPAIGESDAARNVYFCMESGPESALTAEAAAEILLRRYRGESPDEVAETVSPGRAALSRRRLLSGRLQD